MSKRKGGDGHTYWLIYIDDLFPVESTKTCSACNVTQDLSGSTNFCPACGRKMVGEKRIDINEAIKFYNKGF